MNERAVDPVTLEVLRGQLSAVADEMEYALLKSSYSSIVTEAQDATAAVFDAHGRTVAQAAAIPIHLGALCELGRRFHEAFPPGVAKEGDLYLVNDPYSGGTHLPDFGMAAPVFFDGELVGYVATMTHHQDIGGGAPGSAPTDVYDHHAEGLRIPLIRITENGVVNRNIVDLLAANSRSPRNMRGDLDAQVAGCRTGEKRLREVFAAWGADMTNRGIDALMDYAEQLTRRAIEQIPDGNYEFTDWLDNDGLARDSDPVKIHVEMRVRGSDVEFDFTGTDPQVRAAINNVPSSTLSTVYFAIRALTGDAAPNNDGCYRPISAVMPEGTIINPRYPAPINARGVGLSRVIDAVLGAVAQAVPEKVTAAGSGHANVFQVGGTHGDGRRYVGVLGGPLRSGWGARYNKDGIDVADHDLSNAYHMPIEITEAEFPVLYRKLELWPDSGGAGRFRGGLGFTAAVEWQSGDAVVSIRHERHKFAPFGIQGGHSAPLCRTEIVRADGTIEEIPAKVVQPVAAGETFRYWSTGGGGYGAPVARDPHRVLDDVIDGRVSADAARDTYGVVIVHQQIDTRETEQRRAELQATEQGKAQ